MTESIQNIFETGESVSHGAGGTTLCAERSTAQSAQELDFWRFAAEQYGIWLDDDEWCELAELDDHLLIARRFFWRLSDPEVHELLCAVPGADD
jgi:hypothetical protein